MNIALHHFHPLGISLAKKGKLVPDYISSEVANDIWDVRFEHKVDRNKSVPGDGKEFHFVPSYPMNPLR